MTNISVQTGSDEWVTLPNSSFDGGEGAKYNRFSLVSADGVNALATGVTGLRIMFSTNDAHKNDNEDPFRSVREIEALAPVMPVGKSVSVANLRRADDTVAAGETFTGRFTVRKAELNDSESGFARVVAVPADEAAKPIFSLARPFRFRKTGLTIIVR